MQLPLHLLRESDVITPSVMAAISLTVMLTLYAQMAIYIALSLRTLSLYRSRLKDMYAATETINMIWLRNLIAVFSAILLVDMSMNIPAAFFGHPMPFAYNLVLMTEAISIFAIGYYSLNQVEVIMDVTGGKNTESSPLSKYEGSPIDDQLGAEMALKLDGLMEHAQMFRKNDLRLRDLADEMGLSLHHLSQIINQHRNKNFYDYVNSYRAKYAADVLSKSGKTNLTQLAYESGFNNRVSFNNAFKKQTGTTPSAFLDERRTNVKQPDGYTDA